MNIQNNYTWYEFKVRMQKMECTDFFINKWKMNSDNQSHEDFYSKNKIYWTKYINKKLLSIL